MASILERRSFAWQQVIGGLFHRLDLSESRLAEHWCPEAEIRQKGPIHFAAW